MNIRSRIKTIVLFALLLGCTKVVEHEPVIRYVQAFNTAVQVSVYDTSVTPGQIAAGINAFEKEVLRLEALLDNSSDTGTVSKFNSTSQKVWELPEELAAVVEKGIQWGDRSDGLFDITIKPVMDLYSFKEDFTPPDSAAIGNALKYVDYRKLSLKGNALTRSDQTIDLSHIAKGYTINKAAKILQERDINDFLINAGGIIQFSWTHPAVPATIYVRHPRQLGKYYGQFKLFNSCGLATAADYQKWSDYEGVRYHHLISPKTGKPENSIVAISVIATNAYVADFYATYLFLLGREKAKNLVTDHKAIEAIIIWEEMGQLKHWVSEGLQDNFELNENN